MNKPAISPLLNAKINVLNFFAFLFFASLAGVFLYYKTLGGVGFAMATGFFEMKDGMIHLLLAGLTLVLAYVLCRTRKKYLRALLALVSLSLLAFVVSQLVIWWSKYNDGLFWGGEVLQSLSVDDVLYFTLYYFITFFQSVFALVLAVAYMMSSIKGESNIIYFNRFILFSVLRPFVFSVLCIVVFYHLWN